MFVSRRPRISVVISQDVLTGFRKFQIEDDDADEIECVEVPEQREGDISAAVAPSFLAGLPLFAETPRNFVDSITKLTEDVSALPVAPPPPMVSQVSGSHTPIDIKALMNLQDDDEAPPPPPPRRESPAASSAAISTPTVTTTSITSTPVVPSTGSNSSIKDFKALLAQSLAVGPRISPTSSTATTDTVPTSTVSSDMTVDVNANADGSSVVSPRPPPLPTAIPTPRVSPPPIPSPSASLLSSTIDEETGRPSTPPPAQVDLEIVPQTPQSLPPSLPPTVTTPSVISTASFFAPVGTPIVAERSSDVPVTRSVSYSLSHYPVNHTKPKADLTSVGELQVHEIDGGTSVKDVKRTAHVTYDSITGQFTGVPIEWQDELKKAFGLPLQLCVSQEVEGYTGRIPPVLVLMKAYLIQHGGLQQRGIFRLAPEGNEAVTVKSQLNNGTFTGCSDVNVIANLLKVWFRDMPSRLLDTIKETKLITECDTKEQAGETITSKFKDPQLSVMLWLLDLCADVSTYSSVNMMNPQNMAIVFAPNLFKLADSGTDSGMDPIQLMSVCKKYTSFLERAIEWRLTDTTRPQLKL